MDDIVKQALTKWPNVPACYGWLGLDVRGRWYMRDDAVQAHGPFPASKGALLEHSKLIAFIHRNYEADEQGQWYFQNGPQRVYVELESTPWIWRVDDSGVVTAHTGQPADVQECLLDEQGRVYLQTSLGLGLVHSLDVPVVAEWVEQGRWQPVEIRADAIPQHGGFVRSPQQRKSPLDGGLV